MNKTILDQVLNDIDNLKAKAGHAEILADFLCKALDHYGDSMDRMFLCRSRRILNEFDSVYPLDGCPDRAPK